MPLFNVLVDGRSRLSATVALFIVEIQRGDAMRAVNAVESNPMIRWLSGVVAHNLIVALLPDTS
jgi:hypothetical protein